MTATKRVRLAAYVALALWLLCLAAVAWFVIAMFPRNAWAQSWSLQQRQANSLVADGDAIVASGLSKNFGLVLAGYDGANFQFLSSTAAGYMEVAVGGGGSFGVAADDDSAFVHGTGDVTPAGLLFDDVLSNDPEENDVALARMDSKRAAVARIEGETRGVSADVLTLGADDTVNTTNGLVTYAMTMGYESVGGVWDRWRIDTSGSGFVSLATALDSSIDSISFAINDVIPQLDSTDRMAVSIYGFNAAAGDTQPTVTTTQANGLATTLDTLNVTNFPMAYDTGGANFDLMSVGMVTGYGIMGATPDRATITNATTNAATDLAVGFYDIQIIADSTDTVFCVQDAASGSTASATSDMPFVAGLVYRVQVTSTSLDSFECITSAGQAFFYITPKTF